MQKIVFSIFIFTLSTYAQEYPEITRKKLESNISKNVQTLVQVKREKKINLLNNTHRQPDLIPVPIHLPYTFFLVSRYKPEIYWVMCPECKFKVKLLDPMSCKQEMITHIFFKHYWLTLTKAIVTTHSRKLPHIEINEFISCNTKSPSCCPVGDCSFIAYIRNTAYRHLIDHIEFHDKAQETVKAPTNTNMAIKTILNQ